MLVDDGSSTVSLPELPLLAVLPGTGGLTRVTDKRKVRRDHADVFCTTEEGIKGKRAVDWRLVDEVVPGSKLEETVAKRAKEFAARSDRPAGAKGIALTPLERERSADAVEYGARLGRARARPIGSPPSRCAAPTRRRRRPPMRWSRRAPTSGRCGGARARRRDPRYPRQRARDRRDRVQVLRRSGAGHRLRHGFSMPTRTTGSRARSGACGSGCSSASISPRARSLHWSSPARASPARSPSSCSRPTAPTC